jgi:hypothetical protein
MYCYHHGTHATCSVYFGSIIYVTVEYYLIGYNILRRRVLGRLEFGLGFQTPGSLAMSCVERQTAI